MPLLSWHDSLLLVSCFTSAVGLGWFCRAPIAEPSDAEAIQETMVRLSFVYWIVYCCAHWGEQFCAAAPQQLTCSLRILMLLSYILTFCCVLSLPLHILEQRRKQPN